MNSVAVLSIINTSMNSKLTGAGAVSTGRENQCGIGNFKIPRAWKQKLFSMSHLTDDICHFWAYMTGFKTRYQEINLLCAVVFVWRKWILTNGCKDHAQKFWDQSDHWFSFNYFFKCRTVQIWVGKILMFFFVRSWFRQKKCTYRPNFFLFILSWNEDDADLFFMVLL